MSRLDDLALAAADALDDMRDPFSTEFLVEHNVTADECFDLSNRIAGAIRALQVLTPLERATALARTALPEELRPAFDQAVAMKRITKQLRGMRP